MTICWHCIVVFSIKNLTMFRFFENISNVFLMKRLEKPKFSKVHLSYLSIRTAHGYNRNTRLRAETWIVTFLFGINSITLLHFTYYFFQIHLQSFCNVILYSDRHLILQVCGDPSYTLCIKNVSRRRDNFYIKCLLATEYIGCVLEFGINRNTRWPRVNRGDSVGQHVMAPHDGGRGRENSFKQS